VPVLISRVNRVSARTPAPTRAAGSADILRASAGHFMRGGATGQSSSEHESSDVGAMALTTEVLELVPNSADVTASDIRVDELWTGDFTIYFLFYVLHQNWVDPHGRKVWAR
jgi:hypothetical protein